MPGFGTTVSHSLGVAAATERLRTFIEDVRRDHGDKLGDVRGEWKESILHFGFTAFGLAIHGTMEVLESSVQVSGRLPLAAALFRGQVEKTIRDELVKELSRGSS